MTGVKVRDFIYDVEHARQYMRGSLFFHKEDLIYVHDVVRNYVDCTYLNRPDTLDRISLDDVEIKDYPLGYVNVPEREEVLTVIRAPRRTWKYGLNAANIYIQNNKTGWSRESILTSPYIEKTIKKEFPTVVQAQEQGGCAFHNDYALTVDNLLLWRYWEEPVGILKNGEIELHRPFAFLKEELSEITGMLTVPCPQ